MSPSLLPTLNTDAINAMKPKPFSIDVLNVTASTLGIIFFPQILWQTELETEEKELIPDCH